MVEIGLMLVDVTEIPEIKVTFWGDSAVQVSMLSETDYKRYIQGNLLKFVQ